MSINPIKSLVLSKTGQKFYKWICDENKQTFLNNTLPTVESAVASAAYIVSTEAQTSIPREQKNILNWQTLISGAVGIMAGSYLNKKASNFVDKVSPHIDKNLIDVHKVKAGLAIGIPAVVTCLIMRFTLPVISAQLSSIIEGKRRKEKSKLNKIA